MMRAVVFVGVLVAASAANAQDTSGNPEAGRLSCGHCRAGLTASYRNRAGSSDHRQHTRNGDRRRAAYEVKVLIPAVRGRSG